MFAQALGIAHDIVLAQQGQVFCAALFCGAQPIDAVRTPRAALVEEDDAIALERLADKPRRFDWPRGRKARATLQIQQRRQVLAAGRDYFAGIESKSPARIVIIPRDFQGVFNNIVAEAAVVSHAHPG